MGAVAARAAGNGRAGAISADRGADCRGYDKRRTQSGIDFLFNSAVRRFGLRGGTRASTASGNFGLEARALSLVLDRAGQTRAMLSAFYQDSKAVIRSRPRLVVKSGDTAKLEVGNEIPTISQMAAGDQNVVGPINTVQQVAVPPHRGGAYDHADRASQRPSGLGSRSQRKRGAQHRRSEPLDAHHLESHVDHQPHLARRRFAVDGRPNLGQQQRRQTGVPGLAKLPGLGRLFRVDSGQRDTTEMVLMVIPYVIADHTEGQASPSASRPL